MKIQSGNHRGNSINFNNQDIKFDKDGIAEVSDELGNDMIKNFPNKFWKEGEKPKSVEIKNIDTENVDSAVVQRLKDEIIRKNVIIDEKDKTIEKIKESEKTWREEYEKLLKEISELKTSIESSKGKEPESTKTETKEEEGEEKVDYSKKYGVEVSEDLVEIVQEMESKEVNEIKAWLKENGLTSGKELNPVKDKDKLIKFAIEALNK